MSSASNGITQTPACSRETFLFGRQHRGGQKIRKSRLRRLHSAADIGRRAFEPLTFICGQSSGLPTVKTASFYLFGSIISIFPRTWGHPKNRPDFHRNARSIFIKRFPIYSFIPRMRLTMALKIVKTDCRFVLCKMCHQHLIKIVFV